MVSIELERRGEERRGEERRGEERGERREEREERINKSCREFLRLDGFFLLSY